MTSTQAPRAQQSRPELASLLRPQRVAVVGATDRVDTFTGGTLVNLRRHGFTGDVYPINPRRDTVGGLPAYPDLSSVPTSIDSAVVVVRADLVVPTLRDCVEAGATSAIVVSSGFGEGAADESGRRRAGELKAFLAAHPIPVLGPSTTGLVNLNDGYVPRAVTNHLPPERLRAGSVALISQSGAANNAVFNRGQAHGVPIGLAVATGVQANLGVWDVVLDALHDPRIEVVALLVEDLGTPDDYEAALRTAADSGKPIIVLRTGRSEVGGVAIRTHTDSLAGNWEVEREMLRALGATVVDDLDQLWEIAQIARHWGRPIAGDQVSIGVLGLSGGEGALIADQAADHGIELPPVSTAFEKLVAAQLDLAGAGNPFDPTGEALGRPENGLAAIEGFITENDFDLTLLALNAQSAPTGDGLLPSTLSVAAGTGRRVAVSYWEIAGYSDGLVEAFDDFPGPALPGSHRAIAALAAWGRTRSPAPAPPASTGPRSRTARTTLAQATAESHYWTARQTLGSVGIPFADAELAHDIDDTVRAAEAVGYPVVLKANVPSTVHKAAAGLVRIGLRDAAEVRAAAGTLLAAGNGVVVEQAIVASAHLIVGTSRDPQVGSVVLVGTGGGLAEELKDTAVCPVRLLSLETARRAILDTAIGRHLATRSPHQLDVVIDLVVRLGHTIDGLPISVDLNPIAITDTGVFALDARIDVGARP